jgi:EAL domain-containing protein (putative c-di-GMP-specific phosphodiesterase class I)
MAIREKVVALGRQIDPEADLGVREKSMALGGGAIRDEDAARAMMFAVRAFADKGIEHFVGGSLAGSMQMLVTDTVARIEMMKRTLEERKIAIALQRIVGIADRRLHHFEALCRTADGDSPADMIGFAEQVGLAGDIDLLVGGKVIDILLDAAAKGIKPEIAVNLSAASLESDIFISAFRALVAEHPALRPQILIEVTESARIRDLSVADRVIQQLRRDGHRVCLDDFGAGAAALPYIQALTVDYVKIDGAYVRRMLDDARDTAILRAIVGLCRDLKTGVIAEMIETEPQARRLQELGVQFGQGYLFGRPLVEGALDGLRPSSTPKNLKRKGYVETWS